MSHAAAHQLLLLLLRCGGGRAHTLTSSRAYSNLPDTRPLVLLVRRRLRLACRDGPGDGRSAPSSCGVAAMTCSDAFAPPLPVLAPAAEEVEWLEVADMVRAGHAAVGRVDGSESLAMLMTFAL